ncbi:MAG: hypothetical protein UV61_C0008G0071 [Candidatus Gottesmanbacteria bacterium GW2011_GWB1_43_11]|uniref:Uncharacterized protein n=1 Tax=Candidatus Gottesmanbacteria bacterium GW2011_GWB1_43_11 TaxID=1618446 RepID=A0A0G1FIG1_9BACT|nr:MAG: hypothetical protein UV04_C0003G0072 [Candidatus Gottesmanbacteria bacterium GW2011_GWA2_42_16]KKS51658.1 MAG: hypothetical protein UV17_C0059G0005 [Candidatus Gottesmanbacteria bacterium GW2011_GWA1_42_26]KKS82103.1 MAG: hypothetical protein UV55_C0005G0021 [Candidatus Gottesmanbacteria bacterium GW2011_GWC1_43_10]KKS86618.1 MAG: hypothetical protein UV61_C0008G0071 [Candidatus Gottesmanbacteria bacterium GW2011_GWB1_43_11]OGG09204.1 MAG: hypothetical protein A2699_02460 [Candidatus Go
MDSLKQHNLFAKNQTKKDAVDWHLTHKMPKNPTLAERIAWHTDHKKFCACRPIPKSLEIYFKTN